MNQNSNENNRRQMGGQELGHTLTKLFGRPGEVHFTTHFTRLGTSLDPCFPHFLKYGGSSLVILVAHWECDLGLKNAFR